MATNAVPVLRPRKKVPPVKKALSSPAPAGKFMSDNYEARPYQLELLDASIEENTIVNLGTGAGKTFIAVMLIKELCSSILLPFDDEDAKRTVFLVTTVPLVKQQASYIAAHTCFNVGQYVGEMKVDSWSLEKWHEEFGKNQVLVMTMTIFKNLVLQNYLPLKKVNLLIFDECHHTVKNHDYVQIMKLFKPHLDAGEEVPRILGLTASLIPSKCKPGDIKKKILDLEEILCSRSQTARDLIQVAMFATDPKEEVIEYDSSDLDRDIFHLTAIVEDCVEFLDNFKKRYKDSFIYQMVKLYLDDLLHLLENLGIWCADCFAKEGLRVIEETISESGNYLATRWEKPLLYLGRTRLKVFLQESSKILERVRHKEEYPTTNKVKRLAHYLGDLAVVSGDFNASSSAKKDPDKLLGIVFVERRTTAAMLTKLLNHLKESQPDLRHIRCDYVVGHNEGKKGTYLRREAKMNVRKQSEVLDKFRKEKINLLISTSVVEEGVDVPRCNAVVRFDFPQNLRAFVQSKGRARAKVSKYLLLINKKEKDKQWSDLIDYRTLEKELKSICQDRHVPDEEAILARMEEIIEPYMPLGRDGPIANLGSSLSLVHKYCQKLPKDRYTILTPVFKTNKICGFAPDEEALFQSVVTLPMSCPVHDPIEGQPTESRRTAEKSAALEAVKCLHQAGELDNHLRLLVRDDDSDVEDEEKMAAKSVPNAGTEKRNDYYPNRVASSLSGCLPTASSANYLYIFLIHEADIHASLYQYLLQPPASTFGILTSKPIPHLKVPKFSLYEGDTQLNIEVIQYHRRLDISQVELNKLKLCHEVLFTGLLEITASWLHLTFESSNKDYLVVPLSILPDEDPLEAFLNMEVADTIIKLKSPSGNAFTVPEPVKAWPLPLESFHDAIVKDLHLPPGQNKLYEVKNVDRKTTLQSPFPELSAAATYREYFQVKYGYKFTDFNQPALDCKRLGLREKRFKLLTSRFKSSSGEDFEKRNRSSEIKLFPELCSLFPVPTSIWKLACCLPSILWRLECILSVEDFRSKVALETDIGLDGDNVEITTETYLHGYEDHGFGDLLTQTFKTELGVVTRQPVSSPDISALTKRGPDNALLLQAFTPKGAKDSIDLERLETLGDSFLKLATSVYLFHDRAAAHEGKLSSARSRRVGNLNLFFLAQKDTKKITEHILSTSFEPKQMWTPPCFSVVADESPAGSSGEERSSSIQTRLYLQHKVTDKGVADCVESLIGAYLVSGGIDAGLRFMKWVGIKIEPEAPVAGTEEMEGPVTRGQEMEECESDSSSSRGSGELSTGSSQRESGELASSSNSSASSLTPPAPKRLAAVNQLSSSLEAVPSARPHYLLSQLRKTVAEKFPLFIRCSSAVFQKHFPPRPAPMLTDQQRQDVEKLLDKSHGTNDKLKKFFRCIKDRRLLLQAVTHASYSKNRVTDCYQRLEFLGDAVLDYLVTCHIYSQFPKYTPGDISNMRTALVNNNTFAELAVKLELHKAILHLSPALFTQIGSYVSMLGDVASDVEDLEQLHVVMTDKELQQASQSTSAEQMEVNDRATPLQRTESPDSDTEDVDELDPPKALGDILESVAGAIFVDSGCCLESVWRVFKPLFDEKIASFNGKVPIMPVQELFEREPTAKTTKTKAGQGMVRCTISFVDKLGEVRKISAKGRTYKGARMAAAKAALREMDRQE